MCLIGPNSFSHILGDQNSSQIKKREGHSGSFAARCSNVLITGVGSLSALTNKSYCNLEDIDEPKCCPECR